MPGREKATSLRGFCPACSHSSTAIHFSRVRRRLSFQGPYIVPLIEKRGGEQGRGVVEERRGGGPARIERHRKPSFGRDPCSHLRCGPGSEKGILTFTIKRCEAHFQAWHYLPEVLHCTWLCIKATELPSRGGADKAEPPPPPPSQECVREHMQPKETPVSAAPHKPSVIYHFLQLAAGPARTKCQIAGGGPSSSQVLASHPNRLKLGFKTTCEKER